MRLEHGLIALDSDPSDGSNAGWPPSFFPLKTSALILYSLCALG
jgi:hypothetical protein